MSEPIKTFLSSFLAYPQDWKTLLIKNWATVFGEMSNHVTCEKIDDHTITLGVYDSCWLQELYLLTPSLLKAINTHIGAPHITQIRFKKVSRKTASVESKHPVYTKPIPVKILTTAERMALERVIDPELQVALKNFLLRCHTINHMDKRHS